MPVELVFARQERPVGLSTLEQVRALKEEAEAAASTAATDAVEAAGHAIAEAVQEAAGQAATDAAEQAAAAVAPAAANAIRAEVAADADRAEAAAGTAATEAATLAAQQAAEQAAPIAAAAIRAEVEAELQTAQTAAGTATSEANRAALAASTAAVNADVYADAATGRAAVADGAQFQVVAGDEIVRYRRDSATTHTEVGRFPSAAGVFGSGYRAALRKATRKIVEGTGTVAPAVRMYRIWEAGKEYRIDVIARSGERQFLNLFNNGGFIFDVTFNLMLGTVSGGGGSIVPLGEGWYRCRVQGVATASTAGNIQCRMFSNSGTASYTGDGTSGLYVDAVSLVDPAVGSELLTSGDLLSPDWTKVGATVVNATVDNLIDAERLNATARAISGVMSGDKIVEAAGASVSPTVYRSSGAVIEGATYVHDVVAKAGERHRLNLYNNSASLGYNCTFDLLAGTASGTGATIEHLGEGWYSCKVTKAATTTASGNCQVRVFPAVGQHPYAGDGASGLFINSASLKRGGVEVWAGGDLFASTSWIKLGATVLPDVALFRTLKIDGPSGQAPAYFQGKKWAAIGTSVTAQNQYLPVVASALGLTAQNLGVSGGSIAAGSHYGALTIYNAIASIDVDAALVTIEAGTNDFGADNSDLGALGDTTTATFYGALYAAVVAIRARAPAAKIVFLTPYSGDARTATHRHFRVNSKSHTLRQFQTAVKEVSAFLGLPCVNVGEEAGLGYLTLGPYSDDGLHPNALGGARFGSFVAAKLNEFAAAGMMTA